MRYYTCPVIGDGTRENPFRPKVAEYKCTFGSTFEAQGEKNAIVMVDASEEVFAQIDADLEITPMTGTMGEIKQSIELYAQVPVELSEQIVLEEVTAWL